MMYGRGLDYGYGVMGGGWLGLLMMLFFGALVVAGIVLVAVWAVRSSGHGHAGGAAQHPGAVGHDEAVSIAKRRFANGEITKDQYDEIMRSLAG
jgi:putative membrane protein